MRNLVFQSKYPVFRTKTLDFDQSTRYFELEILKYLEFGILTISSEISSISKTCNFD